ncbi:MAG: hypothetical protein AAFQ68_05275 [Bacteroidota bacterium]
MPRKKRSPLGYIFSALLLPTCLLLASKELMGNSSNMEALVFFSFFFLALSIIWDITGMIALKQEGVQRRITIGISMILFQVVVYALLWQSLGIKIGEISF